MRLADLTSDRVTTHEVKYGDDWVTRTGWPFDNKTVQRSYLSYG